MDANMVLALGLGMCKNWYPNSRTLSDDHAHRGAKDYRSARTFAVKPRAFGAPLLGIGA